jgi:hypothetical protein
VGRVLGNARQDVGQSGLRVDLVHRGGRDQRRYRGGAIGAAFGAGE